MSVSISMPTPTSMPIRIAAMAALTAALLCTGCVSAKRAPDAGISDPFERANRAVLKFNLALDRVALKPTAKAYAKLPQGMRGGIGNVFSNLREPGTIVNELLQGKPRGAARSTGRLVINSTIGLLGWFDVAGKWGLASHHEDFGQTLAVWGVASGPYLVLPFFGPSNLRDTGGFVVGQTYTDPTALIEPNETRNAVTALRIVDRRAQFLGADELLEVQPDKYLFLRQTYLQQRAVDIRDGEGADEDEVFLDELFDD